MSRENPENPPAPDSQRTSGRHDADSSVFVQLIATFYRGEVDRTTSWRTRLDQTTNWAVVVVAAILTWAFSSSENPHYVVLIGVFGVTAFLIMETHRYREYDIWRRRVRTLQKELFAETLAPRRPSHTDWRTKLAGDLRNPAFGLSFYQAFTHRLRRSYLGLLLILLAAWLLRIVLLEPDEPWQTTAAIMGIPGEVIVAIVGGYYLVIVTLAVWSALGTRVREFQQ